MVPQIVVFSDGTDVVSTEFEPADVPRTAAELGVPIYTIALSNESLDQQESQEGQNYMGQIAAGTLAQSTRLSTAEELQPIWERISSFREQTTVQYSIPEAKGGDYTVELSLTNNANISDTAVVTIPPGAPTVSINLPEDSRSLSLPNLDQPVTLSLTTSVSWLDGVEREIETAQLLVNGLIVQDIDPGNLAKFDAPLSNLTFGTNKIQIAIIDDQGSRAISPEVSLEISQGETSIPETVAPSTLTERIWDRVRGVTIFIGGCLGILIVLVLLIGITYLGRRSSFLNRIGLVSFFYRVPFLRGYFADARNITYKADYAKSMGGSASRYSSDIRGAGSRRGGKSRSNLPAFLEVIQATTQMPSRIELDAVEQKIGRSKSRADISFNRDATVSRVHATIVQEGDDYRIYDENSTSGTFVNEQGVLDHGLQLVDGDEIRLGAVRLRFRKS
jgi:pSer/pThr/pTyr-binding forkhead associated (FHA) protein